MRGLGWELGLGVPLLWGESLFHPSGQEVMRVPSEDGGENEEAWQRGTAREVAHRDSGLAVVGGCGSGAQKGLGAGEGVAVLMNCHKLGETAEVHSVTVWEVRGLKSSCQSSAPSEGSVEGPCCLFQPLAAPGVPWLMAALPQAALLCEGHVKGLSLCVSVSFPRPKRTQSLELGPTLNSG